MMNFHTYSQKNPHIKKRTINLYFGEQHEDTLKRFDNLSTRLRRSRTQTLDYLLNYVECREEDLKYFRMMG